MTEKIKEETKKSDLGSLEEDDEFEEFPADEWEEDSQEPDIFWEERWDDDNIEEDFSVELKAALQKTK